MKRLSGKFAVLMALAGMVFPLMAAERHFVPIAVEGQEVEYDDGDAALLARTERVFVVASYIPRDKKSCLVKIELRNIGGASFTVSESDITAASGQEPLEVATYAERLKAQKREAMWANIALGMAAAADGYNAGAAGYSETKGSYTGSVGRSSFSGTYSEKTYDSTAAYQAQTLAQMRSQQLSEMQAASAKFARLELKDRAFKTNTLSPGELVIGDVQLSLPKKNKKVPAEFVMSLVVAGESVRLLFRER